MMADCSLTLPDGRGLAWCERGDAAGSVVFAFHGLPGSRLQAHPDDSIAYGAGARVVHVDRPGFGRSDPCIGGTLADWASDIGRLADQLLVDRFAVVGVSGGGPYACACAAILGARITCAAIVSGVGPPQSMALSKSRLVRFGFWAVPRLPSWPVAPPIALAALLVVRAPGFCLDRLVEQLPECDREILCRPEIRAMCLRDLPEAFRHGYGGFLRDLRLEARPWGIALERVICPVSLWHGGDDTIVPPVASETLAALLPRATVRLIPGAGHFFVFSRWREILDWVVSQGHPPQQCVAVADRRSGSADGSTVPR